MQYHLTDSQLAQILKAYPNLPATPEQFALMRKLFKAGCNWDILQIGYKPMPPVVDEG